MPSKRLRISYVNLGPLPVFQMFAHLLIACFVLLVACRPAHRHAEQNPNPVPEGSNRANLIETYRASGEMLFVYGTGDSLAAKQYQQLLEKASQAKSRMRMHVLSDQEVSETDLRESAIYLIGSPSNNAILGRLLPQLPFNVTQHSLEFNQQQYGDHATLSIGFYPNPLAPNKALGLITGPTESDVLAYAEHMFLKEYFWYSISSWGYQVFEGGNRRVMGFFDESDPKQWKVGQKMHWDFGNDGALVATIEGIQFFDHQHTYTPEIADSIASTLKADWNTLAAPFELTPTTFKGKVHLYPSAELKGLTTGDTHPIHIDAQDQSLHFVIHPENAGHADETPKLLMIRQMLGPARAPQLERGLAVKMTAEWHRHGWQYWAGHFAAGQNSLSISELIQDSIWEHESPYLKGCMSAALVDFLLHRWGYKGFLEFYKKPELDRLPPLSNDFDRYLATLAMENRAQKIALTPIAPGLQKAFNFAHEGYQIFNGYISDQARQSIAYTADTMGCNAVALIPYSGMSDVHSPNWLEFSEGPGSENDESIVHCIWAAKKVGQAVMIKPQLWPWNDWTGEIEMQTEEDWAKFFDYYYRWIRHYAVMAELYDAEMLCIGVEMSKATLQRPDDWRKMIARLRGVYHGRLSYAANWGEEFEHCQFWDALDYIGINCYYPLSKKDQPSQNDLAQGFADVTSKVEKVAVEMGKPVLFTEIGFRSCQEAWKNPHAEAEGRQQDAQAQNACYAAMFQGLEGKPWLAGIYLWKWPAFMEDGQYDHLGFTPLGKPAARLTRSWFETHH